MYKSRCWPTDYKRLPYVFSVFGAFSVVLTQPRIRNMMATCVQQNKHPLDVAVPAEKYVWNATLQHEVKQILSTTSYKSVTRDDEKN